MNGKKWVDMDGSAITILLLHVICSTRAEPVPVCICPLAEPVPVCIYPFNGYWSFEYKS